MSGRSRRVAFLLSAWVAGCVSVAPNEPEPLDGGVPYACGSEGLPCCHARTCYDGSSCASHRPALVARSAFRSTEQLTGGVTGVSRDDVLFGACPDRAERVRVTVTPRMLAGDPFCVADWLVEDDPTDCRVSVHYGLAAFDSIECVVEAEAMLPDPNDPPTRCVLRAPLTAPVCGNGVLEPGESCDDANLGLDDGCDASCKRTATCGNGAVEPGEGCDDGNAIDADGCAATCVVEACGNGRLDPGEACEPGPSCGSACTPAIGCGDGTRAVGEGCDDGNAASLDGCSSACTTEHAFVMRGLRLIDPATPGGPLCDYSGDGARDAVLNDGLGTLGALLILATQPAFATSPHGGAYLIGLDDPSLATTDTSLRLATLALLDLDGDVADDFSGVEPFRVGPEVREGDRPLYSQACSLEGRVLRCRGGTLRLPLLNSIVAYLADAQVEANLTVDASSGTERILPEAGSLGLCGALPLSLLDDYEDVFGPFASGSPGTTVPLAPCDPELVRRDVTLTDVILSGAVLTASGLYLINPTQPDVDLDGDGLEYFVLTPSTADCQGTVAACIDGDGTVVEGHACTRDPRFVDGWSVFGALDVAGAIIQP